MIVVVLAGLLSLHLRVSQWIVTMVRKVDRMSLSVTGSVLGEQSDKKSLCLFGGILYCRDVRARYAVSRSG